MVAAALAVGLAACGSGGTSSSGTSPSKSKKLTDVSLALTGFGSTKLTVDVAKDEGFFKDQGLKVTTTHLSTSLAVDAVEAGKEDYALGGGTTANVAAMKGGAARVFSVVVDKESFVVVAGSDITSLSQLEGKTVGGSGTTSANTTLFEELLKQKGIPATSVNILNQSGGSKGQVALLEAGKIDAAVIDVAYFVNLPKGYHVLYTFATSPFQGMYASVVSTNSFASAHKTETTELITALDQASKFIRTQQSKMVPFIAADFSVTMTTAPKLWKVLKSIYTTGPKASKALIQAQVQEDELVAGVSAKPKTSELFNWSYVPGTAA